MLTKAKNLRAVDTFCFFPEDRDSLGLRDEHDKLLEIYWREVSDMFHPITGASSSVESILETLQTDISRAIANKRLPIRVLIDISACPRYLSLSLFGSLFVAGLSSSVQLFYGEGRYRSSEPLEIAFTGGSWRVIAVPPFVGQYDGSLPKSYMISTGFEGNKTARAVSQAEPDKVSLLLPEPGFIQEYGGRSQIESVRLVQEFSIPDERILAAPAGDSIAAWKAIANISNLGTRDNLFFLCAGTKAHSFGLALQCLCTRKASLLYVVPDEHKVLDIAPSVTQWLFEIKDLTAFEKTTERA